MENASKALIMAAGTLIGILVISLATYLFVDFGSTSARINAEVEQQRILQFNSQFTSYIDKELTIYDIITILGYAQENNNYYDGAQEERVDVSLEGITGRITDYNEERKLNLITINSNNGNLQNFRLQDENITYHDNGKICSIRFIKQP